MPFALPTPIDGNLEKVCKLKRILIANNGLAAVKFILSIRNWATDVLLDPKYFTFICLVSDDDLQSGSAFVDLADEIVNLPGGPSKNNYGCVDSIVEAAVSRSANAVWAGWGHASENPALPEALGKCSPPIEFMGPDHSSMRSLGDKVASLLLAQAAGVPTAPWNGSDIKSSSGEVSDDVYKKACIHTSEEAIECTTNIGFPLMIKASEGGGGKGIRRVEKLEMVKEAFSAVSSEVQGSPIFIMKCIEGARHLEIQTACDKYGNVATLLGRDCSLQRRHQKLIEEGPVTIAPYEICCQMEICAMRLMKLINYHGVGTVEFLFLPSTSQFYFLEVNPRLQVEHPVTEMITRTNLPSIQLQIAAGVPLDWY